MGSDARKPTGSTRKTMVESPTLRRTTQESVSTVSSADSLRRTVLEDIPGPAEAPPIPAQKSRAKAAQPSGAKGQTQTAEFCPSSRPPLARLEILDDRGGGAETVRIRTSPFRIGRAEGDVVIPHDVQMSGTHAEISRQAQGESWKWTLTDLGSTNGVFVRVAEAVLKHGQEVFLGGRLYRFETTAKEESPPTDNLRGTMVAAGTRGASASGAAAVLIEMNGQERHLPLAPGEHWIGQEQGRCEIVVDDPMLGSQDAKFYCDANQQWFVKKEQSVNGVWVRIESIPLGRGGQFQCGEQRFRFRVT